ncbi:hypothetical protein DYB35_010257 [Aphanomyces astaci]|uniref:Uncharacterized protein n=1 Tax=Aphanomyces astaci TaxID=112090 RepID=A0A397FJN7_APHAT|nr:hypothetical protein DYB35_010257 [Aphanomyces astaci]RHZ30494.1 hypothetical protein DYB31_010936 [Aphanomyces astaci]
MTKPYSSPRAPGRPSAQARPYESAELTVGRKAVLLPDKACSTTKYVYLVFVCEVVSWSYWHACIMLNSFRFN